MENTPVGTLLRISKPYTFPKHDSAAVYFPDGITPAHMLIFCNYRSDPWWNEKHSMVYVMVVGTFRHPDSIFFHWRNPIFAIPPEYFT